MRVERSSQKGKDGKRNRKRKSNPVYGTTDEMGGGSGRKRGYFVRDPERNLVLLPGGRDFEAEMYPEKNGNIRYTNKNACKHCKNRNKCYKGKTNGRNRFYQRIRWRKLVKSGWKQRGRNINKAGRKQKSDMKSKGSKIYIEAKSKKKKCARGCVCPSIRLEPSNEQWEQPIFSLNRVKEGGRGILLSLLGI